MGITQPKCMYGRAAESDEGPSVKSNHLLVKAELTGLWAGKGTKALDKGERNYIKTLNFNNKPFLPFELITLNENSTQ